MSYHHEFPDFGTMDVTIPAGFADSSWHNDVCPSYEKPVRPGVWLKVWVDYADADLREIGGPRFALQLCDDDGARDIITTDDWADILGAIERATEGEA